MATTKLANPIFRQLKDPSKLTPYEEKLLELRKKGLTYRQISEELGGKAKPTTINASFAAIRQKLELLEHEDEQQQRHCQ